MADRAVDLCTSLRQDVFDKHANGNLTVGPGSHNVLGDSVRPRSPSYVFGRSERIYSKPAGTPGPDAYHDMSKTTLGKTFDARIQSVPFTKFGTSDRDDVRVNDAPAPGSYDVVPASNKLRPKSPSYAMSRSSRDAGLLSPMSPGPGAYGVGSGLGRQVVSARPSSARVKFGTSGRSGDNALGGPGPGAYAVDSIDGIGGKPSSSNRPRSATMRIGTGSRFRRTSEGGPGPAYSPDKAALLQSSPSYSFGQDGRDVSRKSRPGSPGPGAYAVEVVDSLGRKQASSYRPSSPITKFGSSNRFSAKGLEGPAPGQYGLVEEPKFAKSARTVFGKSDRQDLHVNEAPGPGAYPGTINSVRPRSAQYRFGTSNRFYGTGSGSAATPGPNSYDLTASMPVLPRAPITKFGTSSRDGKMHLQSSGMIYDLDNALKTTRPRSGRTKIGTAPRFPQDNKFSAPGPGEYGVPKKALRSAPAFTMRAR